MLGSAVTEGIAAMYSHPDYFDPNANTSAPRIVKVFRLVIFAIALLALLR